MVYWAVFAAALVWGVAWALFLQRSALGRWMSARRTWITVVVGIGVDLLLAKIVMEWSEWVTVVAVIALSSVGIITRALWNEWSGSQAVLQRLDSCGRMKGNVLGKGERDGGSA